MRRPGRSIRKAGRRLCPTCASYRIPLRESPTGQRGARLLRCPIQRIESLFGRLLKLADEILVYLYLVGPDGDAK
jgi:hypothetical protein